MVEVHCGCGHFFSVPDSLAGGIANCPACGRAAQVPGFRDPFWRVLQVLALLLWVAVTAVVGITSGAVPAILAGLGFAGLLWLLSRAL